MWIVFLLCSFVLQSSRARTETWPDGARRAEYQVEVTADGEQREGDFRSWHENGTLESEGKYKDDRKTGRWTFFHDDGSRSAEGSFSKGQETGNWEFFHPSGERAARGRYSKGVREGAWRFWLADGSEDPIDTGTYAQDSFRSADGLRLFKGYRLDGERHGDWTSYWPDLSPQLEAHFVRGAAAGTWVFHHPDGSVARGLSARYEDGRLVGEWPEADTVPALAPIEEPPGGGLLQAGMVQAALAEFLALPGAGPLESWNQMVAEKRQPIWVEAGPDALPILLARLQACDPETPAGRLDIGRIDALGLRHLCGGRSLGAFDVGGPLTPAEAREFVATWSTLWAATRGDRWFWNVQVPHLPVEEPDRLLRTPPIFDSTGYGLSVSPEHASRERSRPRRVDAREKALQAALDWLVRNQHADGHWGSQHGPAGLTGGSPGYDKGVTGLALLALLGAGETAIEGPRSDSVLRAVMWLLRVQGPTDGRFQTLWPDEKNPGRTWSHHEWLYEHAIVTQALAEVQIDLQDRALGVCVSRAVELILQARNPYSGWRYEVPPIGDNDTSVTGWMIHALLAAREAGIEADTASALQGGLAWFDEVTDPATGRVGYGAFGELSSRSPANEHFPREKGEAMTAVALLARTALGIEANSDAAIPKGADLISTKMPVWDPEGLGIDVYYWYHATGALHGLGKPWWPRWEKALHAALLDAQVEKGDDRGSWDPIGVWGQAGGSVYSTAMLALCLEVDFR